MVWLCREGQGWVEVVAPGFSSLVQERRGQEFGEAVGGDADLPPGAMQQPMVMSAHQHQIAQLRRTTVGPLPDMMPLTMSGRAMTPREGTAAVAQIQGVAD